MTIKWNRESILVILTGVMILIGLFYYGNLYLVNPLKEEAVFLTETVEAQKKLLEQYSLEAHQVSEQKEIVQKTEEFLPKDAQVTKALITLEQLATKADVSIAEVARTEDEQPEEGIREGFLKSIYTVEMTSESSANFRLLIDQLFKEERVWNITSFAYEKLDQESYTGSMVFELYYYFPQTE